MMRRAGSPPAPSAERAGVRWRRAAPWPRAFSQAPEAAPAAATTGSSRSRLPHRAGGSAGLARARGRVIFSGMNRRRTLAALIALVAFAAALTEQVWASTCDGAMRMADVQEAEAMAGMEHGQ